MRKPRRSAPGSSLSRADTHRVICYLIEEKEDLEEFRPPLSRLCRLIGKRTGIHVVRHQLIALLARAGVRWLTTTQENRLAAKNQTAHVAQSSFEEDADLATSRHQEDFTMSESNGKMTRKPYKRLSCDIIVRAIDELRSRKEELLAKRPSYTSVCREISKKIGVEIQADAFLRLRKSAGVDWISIQEESAAHARAVKAAKPTLLDALAESLAALCQQIGEDLPEPLKQAFPHLVETRGPKPPAPTEMTPGYTAH